MPSMQRVSSAPAKRSPGVFLPLMTGNGGDVLGEVGIHVEHPVGFLQRLGFGGVGGVAFLPEELGGAQEQPGAQFPADDVGPLVDENRQVAVTLNPVLVLRPDDGFAGGADDERFLQFGFRIDDHLAIDGFEAVVGDNRAFLGEAGSVLFFLGEVRKRNEQREIGVDVAGGLETVVQLALHLLPNGVAVGFDDHATAHGRMLGEVAALDHVEVPLRVVLVARGVTLAVSAVLGAFGWLMRCCL